VSIELDAEMISSVTVTPAELDAFIAHYSTACAEALTSSARLERGTHCRFCPARPICPEHTGPLLDLAQFAGPAPAAGDYLAGLATGLELLDAVKDLGTALRDQAKQALHAGGIVPGYALSAGRAVRSWRDEAGAAVALIKMGLTRDDALIETLRSPKQVETRARARGLKVPPEMIVSAHSGVSLVRVENARAPVPGRSDMIYTGGSKIFSFLPTGKSAKWAGNTPKPGANRPESTLNLLEPALTPVAKTGAKSSAELSTRAAYVRPLERLRPPADLSGDGRQLFLDIVLACEPMQFRASDLPLLSAYVRAVEMERTASAHLEREGHIVDGKPSPWLAVLAQSLKAMSTLSHRLRLSPQGRSPTNPKRPQAVSYYDRARLEGQSDDPY
jgi:hypothetical protein